MPLEIGERFGPYDVIAALGAGGMGEVFRVHDPRLGRDVAMKVLPQSLASEPGRLARFEKEARALAALKHPNIVAIYSVEECEGRSFFTMELVEGASVDALLPDGGFPLGRFFELAIPLADAVGAAHRRGITHRDLKPANVMVDADGRVKVLDFGLTKQVEADGRRSVDTEAATKELTEVGQVMGTVPYMSPEQAKGLPVDHRSDIFSLGVVLYELLAGKRPFQGDTKAELVSSILRDAPPPLADRRQALPARLARVVDRCLEKDRERRYQSAIDVRNALEELQRQHESDSLIGSPLRKHRVPRKFAALAAVVIAALAVASVIPWLVARRQSSEDRGVAAGRTADPSRPLPVYDHRQITFNGGSSFPEISADGELVAIWASEAPNEIPVIQIHDLRTGQALGLGERLGLATMRWSPGDSHLLLVWAFPEPATSIVPRFGGEEKTLPTLYPYAAWAPEGDRVVHAAQNWKRLSFVDLATLEETWLSVEAEFGFVLGLGWSVDTDRIAVLAILEEGTEGRIVMIVDPDQGVEATSASSQNLEQLRWGPGGRSLYFVVSGQLVRSELPGESDEELSFESVMPGVPVGSFSLSRDGTRIAYTRPTTKANLWTVDLATDRAGAQQRTRGTLQDFGPALSPDGRSIAFARFRGGVSQITVLDLETSEARDVTSLTGRNYNPRWSPEGGRLAFASTHEGTVQLWSVSADGGRARRMHDGATSGGLDWSPGGRHLAYIAEDARTLAVLDSSSGEVLDTTQSPLGWIFRPRFSPDGRRVAVRLHYGGGRNSLWTYSLDGDEGEWRWGFGQLPPGQLTQRIEVPDLGGRRIRGRVYSRLDGELGAAGFQVSCTGADVALSQSTAPRVTAKNWLLREVVVTCPQGTLGAGVALSAFEGASALFDDVRLEVEGAGGWAALELSNGDFEAEDHLNGWRSWSPVYGYAAYDDCFGGSRCLRLSPLVEGYDLNRFVRLLRWTENGEDIVLQLGSHIYRAVLGTGRLEPVAAIPSQHFTSADLSRDGELLVYSESVVSSDVWLAEQRARENE